MKKAELKFEVQKQLWQLGHKVSDLEGIPGIGYDLLVDGKIRVGIFGILSGEATGVGVSMSYFKDCDIIAAMVDGKKMYARLRKGIIDWKNPVAIFGPKSP